MAQKRKAALPKAQAEASEFRSKPPLQWRPHAVILAGLWAVTLLAYSNSFSADLASDSGTIVRDDPRIQAVAPRNLDAIWSTGYWPDNEDPTLFRPLTTLSYLVNYSILGEGPAPAGYHWVNFLLHAANVALVYALALQLFGSRFRAAAVAGLWAIHPVLTESVTNVVGRADLLAGFGVLAGLLCHTRAAVSFGPRKILWLCALAAAAAIGIFSKEGAIVLLALVPLYDLAFRRERLRAAVPSYAAIAIPMAIFLYRRAQVLATLPSVPIAFVRNPIVGMGFWSGRLTAIQVIGHYMAAILWPSRLSCDYSYNQIPLFDGSFRQWGDWASLLALAACTAALLIAVLEWKRRPALSFSIALFFVPLAPVANIVMPIRAIMADRFLYLPAIGFIGCVVWALAALADRWNRALPRAAVQPVWIFAAIGLALSVRTYARNRDWQNDPALFASAAAASPQSYRTHTAFAHYLYADGKNLDRAIAEGERGLKILQPLPLEKLGDIAPYMETGPLHRVKGDLAANPAEARNQYRRSLEILLRGVEVDRAIAARLRPAKSAGFYQIYRELAIVYLRLGEPRQAIEAVEYGFPIQADVEFLQSLAEAYTDLNDREDAAKTLAGGLLLFPNQTQFASDLARLYQGETSGCALIRDAKGGGSLNPDCPEVHRHLCEGSQRIRDLLERGAQRSQAERVRQMAAQMFGCAEQ